MGKRLNFYYLKYIYMFIIGAAALVLVDIYQLRVPKIVGIVIDRLDLNTLTKSDLKDFAGDMIIIIIVMAIGRFLWRAAIIGVSHLIEHDLKKKMYDKVVELPLEYYVMNKSGNILSYFTSDARVIRQWFGSGTLMLVDASFLGIYTFYRMTRLNLPLALLSMIPLLLIAIISGIIGHYMNLKFLENQKAYDELSSYSEETFRGLFVIKAFVREGLELKRFHKINKNNYDKNMAFNKLSILLNILSELLVWSLGGIIIGYGGYLAYKYKVDNVGTFSPGDLSVFFSYFVIITWPMFAISRLIDMRSQAKAASKRINKLFDEDLKVYDRADAQDVLLKGEKIEFKDLSFAYPDDPAKPVLKNINLTINKGEFIGFIGHTGSGKSSIFDLLLRFYNLGEDMIYLDGNDIMKIKIKNVRNTIGYVDQENFLFSDSIINNVSFSEKENIDINKVYESTKSANVYDSVLKFDNGFDTVLGERGVTISGGQKERLAISRALYQNPNILILDDSLSAVDAKTEKDIIHMIKEVRKDKITILSSNRISSIKNASKIVVLNSGEIEAIGTHEELLESSKSYSEINSLQSLDGGDFDAE